MKKIDLGKSINSNLYDNLRGSINANLRTSFWNSVDASLENSLEGKHFENIH